MQAQEASTRLQALKTIEQQMMIRLQSTQQAHKAIFDNFDTLVKKRTGHGEQLVMNYSSNEGGLNTIQPRDVSLIASKVSSPGHRKNMSMEEGSPGKRANLAAGKDLTRPT